MKPLSILFLTASLALGAAGCGGDDKKTDTTRGYSATRGYDDTIAAVNDICKRARTESKPISAKLNGQAKHDAPLLDDLVKTNQKYVDELDAIKPDPKLADVFGRFKASTDEVQTKAKQVADGARKSSDDSYRASVEALDGYDKANDKIARELGATECAKG